MDEDNEMSGNDDIEAVLRGISTDELELIEPPADLWSRIEGATTAQRTAEVIPLHRRRKAPWILSSAAAVVLAVIGLVSITDRGDSDELIATAALSYDADNFDRLGELASGRAELIDADGLLVIDLASADLPAPEEGADLEVWLIQPDADGNVADLVSLGVVDPDSPGQLEIPATLDPGTFFVVDISVEPRDGVETHSGRSIVRGALIEV
ncbi:MAG: anti-sigma factor [Actinomycetota bacterium]|nr:anti-sigma factor [Actinomycetota bacterium]